MYMAVALLVWVAWIINLKYEVRGRKYENTIGAYLTIMSRSGFARAGFFLFAGAGKAFGDEWPQPCCRLCKPADMAAEERRRIDCCISHFLLISCGKSPVHENRFILAVYSFLWLHNGAGLYTPCPYAKRRAA